MRLIAIDPGSEQSAFVIWDGKRIFDKGILDNFEMRDMLRAFEKKLRHDYIIVIEEVQCYGMPVGKSIFETVYWSGIFSEAFPGTVHRMPRKDVKMHLCHTMRAKDSNVIQALVDRFAPFAKNRGKGVKSAPGFFFGFKKDIWQACALGVVFWDQNMS